MTVTASFLAFKLLRDNDNSETPSDIGNKQKIKTDTAADDETVHNSPSLPEGYEILILMNLKTTYIPATENILINRSWKT